MEESSKKNVVNHFATGSNCQVFNGNITDCVFAMPGSTVGQGRINENDNQNENTEQARADESLLSVCRAKGVSTEGQNENQNYKERVIDNKVLKKAVGKVKPFMWAASAYAVLYCVCRDKYGIPDNMSQFEREFSNSKTGYTCKEGVISSTFRTNSYMKLHIDRWEKNGAKERALILKNKFIEEVNNIIQE